MRHRRYNSSETKRARSKSLVDEGNLNQRNLRQPIVWGKRDLDNICGGPSGIRPQLGVDTGPACILLERPNNLRNRLREGNSALNAFTASVLFEGLLERLSISPVGLLWLVM